MKTDYKKLIETIERSIFNSPERALEVGGWNLHGDSMQTGYRLDGSDGGKSCKMRLAYFNGKLILYYNGGSVTSKCVTKFLADKYGENDWMRIVCQMYGIRREDFPAENNNSTFKPRDFKQTYNRPKAYTIGDESDVDSIPQEIVSLTYDRTRPDVLRQYLCSVFGEVEVMRAWELYRVGDAATGHTIWWNYDRQGRCRCGKRMAYRPSGHRDSKDENGKEKKGSTISVGWELKKDSRIPNELKLTPCCFGEHLLAQFPNLPVCVVESEKTAVIMSIVAPSAVWIATGGCNQNLDRLVAILKGRRGSFVPDCDKTVEWKERFGKVRGFTVSEVCRDYCRENGEKWLKCDIGDIVIHNTTKEVKVPVMV